MRAPGGGGGDTQVPRFRGPRSLPPGRRGDGRSGSRTGRGGGERTILGLAPVHRCCPGPASQARLLIKDPGLGERGENAACARPWVTGTRWGFRFDGEGVPFPNSCAGRVGGGGLFPLGY